MRTPLLRQGRFCMRRGLYLFYSHHDLNHSFRCIKTTECGERLDADHICISGKHFLHGGAALRCDRFLQYGACVLGTAVSVYGQRVAQQGCILRCEGIFPQCAAQDRDILHTALCFDGHGKGLVFMAAQPVHAAGGFLRKQCTGAVEMQQHHVQIAAPCCRQQGGLCIAQPFVQYRGQIRQCQQTAALRHADVRKGASHVSGFKEPVHLCAKELAGWGKPL